MNIYQTVLLSIALFVLIILIFLYEQEQFGQIVFEKLNKSVEIDIKVKRNAKNCEKCEVIRKVRVVGGEPTVANQYPWVAALKRKSSGRPFCGGSIISNKFILTAAHCVRTKSPSSFIVRVGAHIFSGETDTNCQDYEIEKYLIHPYFQQFTYENDIALIKIKSSINYTKIISPIELPENEDADFSGQNAIVAGWGRLSGNGHISRELRHVELMVWDNKKCNQFYDKKVKIDENKMFCASGLKGEKDSCTGDSGGPLMVKDQQNKWLAIGLVSWGFGCALPKYPGVYTRVSKYLKWIDMTKNTE